MMGFRVVSSGNAMLDESPAGLGVVPPLLGIVFMCFFACSESLVGVAGMKPAGTTTPACVLDCPVLNHVVASAESSSLAELPTRLVSSLQRPT